MTYEIVEFTEPLEVIETISGTEIYKTTNYKFIKILGRDLAMNDQVYVKLRKHGVEIIRVIITIKDLHKSMDSGKITCLHTGRIFDLKLTDYFYRIVTPDQLRVLRIEAKIAYLDKQLDMQHQLMKRMLDSIDSLEFAINVLAKKELDTMDTQK